MYLTSLWKPLKAFIQTSRREENPAGWDKLCLEHRQICSIVCGWDCIAALELGFSVFFIKPEMLWSICVAKMCAVSDKLGIIWAACETRAFVSTIINAFLMHAVFLSTSEQVLLFLFDNVFRLIYLWAEMHNRDILNYVVLKFTRWSAWIYNGLNNWAVLSVFIIYNDEVQLNKLTSFG